MKLLVASLAVQTFAKEKLGITILLKLDNTTAVAYINRMGDSITYTIAANQRPVAVVYGKKYFITSTAFTRSIKFHYEQGVKDLLRQIRIKA